MSEDLPESPEAAKAKIDVLVSDAIETAFRWTHDLDYKAEESAHKLAMALGILSAQASKAVELEIENIELRKMNNRLLDDAYKKARVEGA